MELFEYQKQGISFLVNNSGGMLLDEQGLGKTIQALEAVKKTNAKVLVIVCPAIMRGTWLHHVANLMPSNIQVVINSYEWYVKLDNYKSLIKSIKGKKYDTG